MYCAFVEFPCFPGGGGGPALPCAHWGTPRFGWLRNTFANAGGNARNLAKMAKGNNDRDNWIKETAAKLQKEAFGKRVLKRFYAKCGWKMRRQMDFNKVINRQSKCDPFALPRLSATQLPLPQTDIGALCDKGFLVRCNGNKFALAQPIMLSLFRLESHETGALDKAVPVLQKVIQDGLPGAVKVSLSWTLQRFGLYSVLCAAAALCFAKVAAIFWAAIAFLR